MNRFFTPLIIVTAAAMAAAVAPVSAPSLAQQAESPEIKPLEPEKTRTDRLNEYFSELKREAKPASARRIERNDRQRIMRALEIYRLTGNPPSNYPTSQQQVIPYRVLKIGIWPARRSVLHDRIASRLEQMFADGFIEEVKRLLARGLDPALPAMRAVGYRQVLEYLRGELDYEQMRARCLASTRQLAKRQLTWLRHDPQIHWFDSEIPDYVEKVLDFVQKNTSVQPIDL